MQEPTAEREEALLGPLRAVAKRRRLRSLAYVGLACVLTALGVLLIGTATRNAGVAPFDPRVLATAAVVAALLAGGLWLLRQRRTMRQLAFAVDRQMGLDQRYATAVEMAVTGEVHSGPVSRALMRAAALDARAIRAAQLVPMATRPMAILAALVLVSAVALTATVQSSGRFQRSAGDAERSAAEMSAAEVDALIESVGAAAELMTSDAETRGDPYLAAVASALRERIENADPSEGSEVLRADLQDLLDHAARAYGRDAPAWLGVADAESLAGLQERLAQFYDDQAAAEARQDRAMQFQDELLDTYGISPGAGERRVSPPANEMDVATIEESAGEAVTGVASDMPPDGVRLMEFAELQEPGGTRVGAAMQSGRGLSDAAGLGSETLEADDTFTAIESTLGAEMVLTAEPEAGGRRIRIEIAPQADPEAIDGAAGALTAASSTPEAEPLQRQLVPAYRRGMIARYFARAPQ